MHRDDGGRSQARHARLAPLDGVRALAILVVMAYHSGIPGLTVGGFYGQDAFFVLSGLLITSLLLREGTASGAIRLVAFWGNRARRLLPALLVVLLVVDLYVRHVAPPGRYPGFSGDLLGTLFYYANWHLIAASSDYFTATGNASLLTHTWSLAIEEQFYVVWPLVVLAVLWLLRRRPQRVAPVMLGISVAGALASAGWMARLAADGATASRLYYGTDTHCQCLLVGAALAAGLRIVVARHGRDGLFPVVSSRLGRGTLGAAGVVGAVGLGWMWTHVSSDTPFAYRGGFLCVALATAAILVSVVCVPAGPLARLLGLRPLAFVGLVSYGMYLWYFPVFAVLTGADTGLRDGWLFLVRAGTVFALAVVSYGLIELPLRRGRLLRVAAPTWSGRARPVAVAGVVVVASLGLVQTSGPRGAPALVSHSAAPHALPAAAAARPPVRVLLIGDSTAYTLGHALNERTPEEAYDYQLTDDGILGCGLAISAAVRSNGSVAITPGQCNPTSPVSQQWPALEQREVATVRPDVVLVVAGRWEVFDRETSLHGDWQNITQPADAAYVKAQLELAASIGGARGAAVELATAPCFSSGEQPDGSPWPEDQPERVTAYNRLVDEVAAEHPGRVSVLPLGSIVCPTGRVVQQVDGVVVRAPDGVHYPFSDPSEPTTASPDTEAQVEQFALWLLPRIRSQLVGAAPVSPAALAAGPGGGR